MSSWQLSYSQIFMPSTGPVPKAFPSLFEQLDALMLVTNDVNLFLFCMSNSCVCLFVYFHTAAHAATATTPGTTRRRRTQHQQRRAYQSTGLFSGARRHSARPLGHCWESRPSPTSTSTSAPRPRGRPRLETREREGSRLSAVRTASFAWLLDASAESLRWCEWAPAGRARVETRGTWLLTYY